MQTVQSLLTILIVITATGWLIWKLTRKKNTPCDSCEGCALPSLDKIKQARGKDRGEKDNPSRTPDNVS